MIRKMNRLHGFTLGEIMIVVTIITILVILGLLTYQQQMIRGQDSKRKSDLSTLRVLFEDYYNDHNCYPQKTLWDGYNCETGEGGSFFTPYLQGRPIPCDPVTNERYFYITIPETIPAYESACSGYKLFAALGNFSDQDIPGSGCDPDPNKGCGYGPPDYPPPASFKYNYGISVGGTVSNPNFDFTAPTPLPTPAFPIGDNFCLGEPNATHTCNTKAGLISPANGGKSCSEVLRNIYGCASFQDGALCQQKCSSAYNSFKCQATEIPGLCQ